MSDTPIEIGQKVELKPGMDGVYQKAGPASQALVLDKKTDTDGFEMLKVQWDREHWRYNGEPDQWTHESHFQVVNVTGLYEAQKNPRDFAAKMIDRAEEEGVPEEQIEKYIDQLNEIVNLLAESEGFIIMTARQEPSPTQPDDDVLIPYAYGSFLSPQAMVLLEAQMMQMAAQAHQEMAERMMERFKRDEGYDD
jgi:hypothetical protein